MEISALQRKNHNVGGMVQNQEEILSKPQIHKKFILKTDILNNFQRIKLR